MASIETKPADAVATQAVQRPALLAEDKTGTQHHAHDHDFVMVHGDSDCSRDQVANGTWNTLMSPDSNAMASTQGSRGCQGS